MSVSGTREALRRLGAPLMTPREAFERLRCLATSGRMSRHGRPGEVVAYAGLAVRHALSQLTAAYINDDVRTETFLAFIEPPSLFRKIARRR